MQPPLSDQIQVMLVPSDGGLILDLGSVPPQALNP
jgi:hypothetical protein